MEVGIRKGVDVGWVMLIVLIECRKCCIGLSRVGERSTW